MRVVCGAEGGYMESKPTLNHRYFLDVVVVDAIEGVAVSKETVCALLEKKRCDVGSTGEFIGKPSTYLCVSDQWVVKLHQDMGLSELVVKKWVQNRLNLEREVGLYHPKRSWFIVEKTKDVWLAGNISPRMCPLHIIVEEPDLDPDKAIALMEDVVGDYLRYSAKTGKRLDEGLSNFGWIDGDIYYLDDDIYLWDHFSAFSALLASWLRRYAGLWMSSDYAYQLGRHTASTLNKVFPLNHGVDGPLSVVEHLKMMFFAEDISASVDGMILGLRYQEGERGVVQLRKRLALEDCEKFFSEADPIAVTSDIHANLPALEAVLAKIHGLEVTRILDLGDIVGYGPFPVECIQRLREVGAVNIRGNHDHMIGNGVVSEAANEVSTWSAKWNMAQLNTKQNTWLRSLPLRMLAKPWMAVHGSPQDKTCFNAYVYARTAERNLHWMVENGYRFCLHGHSHIPGVYALKDNRICVIQDQKEVDLSAFDAALICPGSVGQPRGGSTGTQFAVVFPSELRVSFYHLDYELEKTIQQMIIHQFPEKAITRLQRGV